MDKFLLESDFSSCFCKKNGKSQLRGFISGDYYNVCTTVMLTPIKEINVNENINILNDNRFQDLINTCDFYLNGYVTKFIVKNLIDNFNIYMHLWKQDINYYDFKEFNEIDKIKNILYINSIDELLDIKKSDELFLCCLNDILFKLKLNAKVAITRIADRPTDGYNIEFIPIINDKTKYIKIGYINDESKLYNNDLRVYKNGIYNLIDVIQDSINLVDSTSTTNKFKTFFKNENLYFNDTIRKQLYNGVTSL